MSEDVEEGGQHSYAVDVLGFDEQPCADRAAGASPSPQSMTTERSAREHATFEERVRPQMSRVYRYCVGLTGDRDAAADVFQETLVSAWKHFDSYEGRADLGAWLCGIARNQFLDARRTEIRRRGIFGRVVDAWQSLMGVDEHDEHAGPLRLAIEHQEVDTLLACLQELPEEFRSAVLLCDVEGLSYDEAATALGVPIGTVKSRQARGRMKLRAALEARNQNSDGRSTKVTQ